MLFKHAIKIYYRKRQRVSASGGPPLEPAAGLPSSDLLACAVLEFPLKTPDHTDTTFSCIHYSMQTVK